MNHHPCHHPIEPLLRTHSISLYLQMLSALTAASIWTDPFSAVDSRKRRFTLVSLPAPRLPLKQYHCHSHAREDFIPQLLSVSAQFIPPGTRTSSLTTSSEVPVLRTGLIHFCHAQSRNIEQPPRLPAKHIRVTTFVSHSRIIDMRNYFIALSSYASSTHTHHVSSEVQCERSASSSSSPGTALVTSLRARTSCTPAALLVRRLLAGRFWHWRCGRLASNSGYSLRSFDAVG